MNERDFVGYGPNPPRVEWPDGARIAVSVVVDYEEGSEDSLLDGDAYGVSNNHAPAPGPSAQRALATDPLRRRVQVPAVPRASAESSQGNRSCWGTSWGTKGPVSHPNRRHETAGSPDTYWTSGE